LGKISLINQRDMLLVPFPFSDQSGKKVRPVIVLSNNDFNTNSEDIIVVGITSNIIKDKYSLNFSNNDLDEGKLVTKCLIKVESILKIDQDLAIKKIGKIKEQNLQLIKNKLLELLN